MRVHARSKIRTYHRESESRGSGVIGRTNLPPDQAHLSGAPAFLPSDGETSRLIASYDWGATALGPIAAWPQSLKTAVGLIVHSPVPIVMLWGVDGYMIYNDAYSVFAGARHPGVLGMKVRQAWPEVADFNDNVMKVGLSGGTLAYKDQELTLYRNGVPEKVWMNLDYSPVMDESGRPGGVIAIVVETTERVRADRRRAFRVELADRLAALAHPRELPEAAAGLLGHHLDVSRVGFSEVQADGDTAICDTCYANGVALFTGAFSLSSLGPANAALQRQGKTLVVNDVMADPAQDQAPWAALETRAVVSVPLIRDGHLRATLFVNQREPRRWSTDEVALIEDVAARTWDAVERARAEILLREAKETLEIQVTERTRQLQASEARLRTIFQNSFTHQCFVTLDGRVADANATALESIGATLADIVGQHVSGAPWFSATPGASEQVYHAVALARGGQATRTEMLVNLPVGGWRWFDFAMRPIRAADGQVTAIVAEAVETTERRLAEEALRQAQKLEAMGQLTGGVAHDFNNLLTPILGGLDMLHRRGVGNERERRLIEGALQSAERARTLVQRLLAFARKQPLQPQPVDVAALITNMRDLIASTSGPRIRLELDIEPDLPAATAETGQLEMALLNLAVNARDAMASGGVLAITARSVTVEPSNPLALKPGHYVRITVSDTGIGMDATTLQRAIEPFFSTKGIGRGTGLGLSMVHGLASQLGGALRLASKPGLGTSVELLLPASAVPPDTQVQPKALRRAPRAGVALLVDDEALVRATTADMLFELGYLVVQACGADEALQVLEERKIDLVVTDHLMPGMTGTELAHIMRARQPGLPILVISGYAELEGIAPDLPRLAKPFRGEDLSVTLAGLRRSL